MTAPYPPPPRNLLARLAPYRKAVVAFLVGGLTVAWTALADGAVSPQEWVGIALGALGTPASVYAVANRNR